MHDCGQTYCFGAGEWKRKHKKGQAITAVEGKNNSRIFSSFFWGGVSGTLSLPSCLITAYLYIFHFFTLWSLPLVFPS